MISDKNQPNVGDQNIVHYVKHRCFGLAIKIITYPF